MSYPHKYRKSSFVEGGYYWEKVGRERGEELKRLKARDAKIREVLLSDWFEICRKQPDTAEKWARHYLPDADTLVAGETVIACVLKGTIGRFGADYHDPTIAEMWERAKIGVALLLLEGST